MTTHIGLLLYPGLTQLDLTGPYEVLHRLPSTEVHLLWKTLEIVESDSGLGLRPTTRIDSCPPLDVVMVPGGFGQMALMEDAEILAFLAREGERAAWVTSVCTGALLLGAAGLLRGYEATTHWHYQSLLPMFGAIPKEGRVVVDRNRITGGGVTAGIDFGLRLAAILAGEEHAKGIELGLEYDPEPPFRCGHPRIADPKLVAAVEASFADRLAERQANVANALAKTASSHV